MPALEGLGVEEAHGFVVAGLAERALAGQVVLDQRAYELKAAGDDDVPVYVLLQRRDLVKHVALEDCRVVPGGFGEGRGHDVLGRAVQPVRQLAAARWPPRGEPLVASPGQQEGAPAASASSSAISHLTLGHVDTSDDQARIRLGREPVVLPEPLDALVLQLVATRHGHAAIGDAGTSPWLFPGGQPGQPISAYQLAERLRQLGIRSGQSRSAALFQLATDLPAAIPARLLGIHISAAAAWQRAAAGDWAAYAADISHRLQH